MAKFISKYGIAWPEQIHPIAIELACFRDHHSKKDGGLGASEHLKNVVRRIWCDKHPNINIKPPSIWHRWKDLTYDSILNNMQEDVLQTGDVIYKQKVGLAGCATASKSFSIAEFGLAFWYADPENTGVIVSSTTREGAQGRIWGAIKRLHKYASKIGLPGTLIDSADLITLDPKSKLYDRSIKLRPVYKGNKLESVDNLVGWHPPRLMIILDEMPSVPDHLFKALANLSNVSEEFIFIGIGNPNSRLDPHGRLCTPKDGWSSVDPSMEFWKTKDGICVHYDGLKSPNFDDETLDHYPFLFKKSDYDSLCRTYGEESDEVYRQARGWFPPETSDNNLFNEVVLIKREVFTPPKWKYTLTKVAGLDPAYGGDRCVLYFVEIGVTADNKLVLYPYEYNIIPINSDSKDTIHEQIAFKVRELCNKHNINPDHFGVDSTAEGKRVAEMIIRHWSDGINLVDFADKVSTRPVSYLIPRPANEEYDRKVTELTCSLRQYVETGQLRGLCHETALEGCHRRLLRKPKLSIESKTDYKMREKYSPDLLDALTVACDVARTLGYVPGAPPPYRGMNEYYHSITNPQPKWEEMEAEFSDPYAYN